MNQKALIIVDVQNDFCPGGALAVKDGDQVVGPLNKMIQRAKEKNWLTVFSRDWHPAKTSHFNKWPVHCVKGTRGAKFHKNLKRSPESVVLSKGTNDGEDAYSAFDGKSEYGNTLEQILTANRVTEVYVGGLATDYCVKATVLDALKKGFHVTLLIDACRSVNLKPTDGEAAVAEMVSAGVILKTTEEVANELDN